MTSPSPEDSNPFEPPRAEIGDRAFDLGEDPAADAELIRRHHIGRERAVRAIGLLCYLAAAGAGFFVAIAALLAAGVLKPDRRIEPEMARFASLIFAAEAIAFALACGVASALGFGLRRLQAWARWTAMVLAMIALLILLAMAAFVVAILPPPNSFGLAGFFLFFAAILGYVFFLLVTTRAGVVFSAGYRDVIARTPGVRAGTTRPVKIAAGLVIGAILLLVLAAIFSG